MVDLSKRPYHHRNLPNALRAAARSILDEDGLEGVGLREASRRVGVSATAAYRHFSGKEDLLASVAAQGFRELSARLDAATKERGALLGISLAYIDFAQRNHGLFRLMFGPVLADRAKYPELKDAAANAFRFMQAADSPDDPTLEVKSKTMATWGLIHGLSSMCIDGLIPEERVAPLAQDILTSAAKSPSVFAWWRPVKSPSGGPAALSPA